MRAILVGLVVITDTDRTEAAEKTKAFAHYINQLKL